METASLHSFKNAIWIVLGISCFLSASAQAKKAAVTLAPPVVYKQYEFRASDSPSSMGVVQVWNTKTNEKVSDIVVYKVAIIPFLEADTQWVFITSMSLEWPILTVVNERGKKFTVKVDKYLPQPKS